MEKDESGRQRSDVSFCQGAKPHLVATAVSARVDLYSLTQPTEGSVDCNFIAPNLKIARV